MAHILETFTMNIDTNSLRLNYLYNKGCESKFMATVYLCCPFLQDNALCHAAVVDARYLQSL